MLNKLTGQWRAILDHPILRLELRRIRRKRWWPGRRFFLFYPALLGGALGYLIAWTLMGSSEVKLAIALTATPAACFIGVATWLLAFGLPWIAPALTASAIVREQELGTLDLLRTTLLTERSIVLGKLAGCAARLWPGMLALALLSPFQAALTAIGTPLNPLTTSSPEFTREMWWGWLGLSIAAGLLQPWGNLALHAATGLLVSTLSRSSSVAIVASYGAIVVMRMALWLGRTIVVTMWWMLPATPMPPSPEAVMIAPWLVSLAATLAKFAGAVLLVWAATWRLERM